MTALGDLTAQLDVGIGRPIFITITSHSDPVGAGDRERRVLPPARLRSAAVADTPKTPMTRAEYDAQIMRASREALERSYRVLKDADAVLTSRTPQPNETGPDQDEDSERSRD